MKNIFKQAHKITREIIRKGDNYRATFGLVLSFVYSQQKAGVEMVELKGSEKQVKWATDIRNRMIEINNIFEEATKDTDMTNLNEETLEGMVLQRIDKTRKALKNILNNEDAKFFIDNFRNIRDYMISDLREKSDRAKYISALVSPFRNM